MKVNGRDVDFAGQSFKVTIIKGSSRREVTKVIKDLALHFWEEMTKGCAPDQYVFSKMLKPGYHLIGGLQINRRWRTHVKLKLKIKDFYSLKHLHTDEMAELLGMSAIMSHNDHTSPSTTMIYAVNEKKRQSEKIKGIGNTLAG